MLKIKDSVDLKTLEKYGFEYDEYTDFYTHRYINKYNETVSTTVNSYRYIYTDSKRTNFHLVPLFELIVNGLVERVG